MSFARFKFMLCVERNLTVLRLRRVSRVREAWWSNLGPAENTQNCRWVATTSTTHHLCSSCFAWRYASEMDFR